MRVALVYLTWEKKVSEWLGNRLRLFLFPIPNPYSLPNEIPSFLILDKSVFSEHSISETSIIQGTDICSMQIILTQSLSRKNGIQERVHKGL